MFSILMLILCTALLGVTLIRPKDASFGNIRVRDFQLIFHQRSLKRDAKKTFIDVAQAQSIGFNEPKWIRFDMTFW